MKQIFGILSILTNFIYINKNNNSTTIENISFKKEVETINKEIVFHYKVNPIIFNDTILLDSYYVLGKEMYYSPIIDKSISIIHDPVEQFVKVICLKPFDKRIIIKLFSANNNHIYSKIVLDYKEKFELLSSKLRIDQEENYFYIEPELNKSVGSIKIDSNVKYNNITYTNSFINETKNMMKEKAENIIYSLTNSKDIIFNHQFIGFDNSLILDLFKPSVNKVFSFFSDQVNYSYYDYNENKTVVDSKTYNLYDLLKYNFFYKNQNLFNISYSIDSKTFTGEFSL